MLPVVLYGCETWSLTVRKGYGTRVSENRASKKIFRQKRDKVAGGWRKVNNEEIHSLYSSLDVIRTLKPWKMRWTERSAREGANRVAYKGLAGNSEEKRQLGRN
jgi:hypothetical protein